MTLRTRLAGTLVLILTLLTAVPVLDTSPAGAASPSIGPVPVGTPSDAPAAAPTMPNWVDPALGAALAEAPRTTAIIGLRRQLTGDDTERAAGARAATDELLRSLPTGGVTDVREPGTLPVVIASIDARTLDALRISPLVASVSADAPMEISSAIARAQDGAWASNAAGWKGDGSTIAVIDTGVQSTNPYLRRGTTSKVVGEACFTTPVPAASFTSPCPGGTPMATDVPAVPGSGAPCASADASHFCAHGTHVAGIIAGEPGTPGFGYVSGVAPNTRLVSIQVFGERVVGGVPVVQAQSSDVINALQWLYNRRADYPGLTAVNVSIASTNAANRTDNCDLRETAFKAAIDQLKAVGIATITAAGNSGWTDGLGTPACISSAVSVGAIDDLTLTRLADSNISPSLDLLAPGVDIVSSWPTNVSAAPMIETGTSQATPAVSGAWALLRQRFPGISVSDALSRLRSTGTPVTSTTMSGTVVVPTIAIGRALDTTRVTAVAAGDDFSCARRTDWSIACAGSNTVGQLGNGRNTSNSNPVRVSGITDATAVTAGVQFACARLTASTGTVKCWGHNSVGQLGVGTTTDSNVPVTVLTSADTPLTGIASIDAGGSTVCAVRSPGVSGTAVCWGDNYFRQLGDGTRTNSPHPVDVHADAASVLTGVRSISVGSLSTCALMSTGSVMCWGHNAYGELGNNSTAPSAYPVPVQGIINATAVRVGDGFACALLTTGRAKCWGLGGALGNNSTLNAKVPVDVLTAGNLPLTGITELQAGARRACAIAVVGTTRKVHCWGLDPTVPLTASAVALAVPGTLTDGATALSVGTSHVMAVIPGTIPSTRAVVWGGNTAGQLGIGSTAAQSAPKLALRF